MKRTYLACLTCLYVIAAIALLWIPVHSAASAGPAFQETLPPEGWTVCEVGGLEYIQEVNEVRQVFKVCNADGWEIKVYCTQPGVPAPGAGTGCSLFADGNYWCGATVQVLKFFAILQQPASTDTPTPTDTATPTPTDTPTALEPSATEDTPGPAETPILVDTPTTTETGAPVVIASLTPTATSTQAPVSPTPWRATNTPRPVNNIRPFPGGLGNRTFVIIGLVGMSFAWGIAIWAVVLRRRSGRS